MERAICALGPIARPACQLWVLEHVAAGGVVKDLGWAVAWSPVGADLMREAERMPRRAVVGARPAGDAVALLRLRAEHLRVARCSSGAALADAPARALGLTEVPRGRRVTLRGVRPAGA